MEHPAPPRSSEELCAIAEIALTSVGTPDDLAKVVATSLVEANLCGHDSHGVLRLPAYCKAVVSGDVRPAERASLKSRDRASATIDGKWGWGQPAMQLAAETGLDLAREHTISVTAVQGCYHIGRAAPYVEFIARSGMIGLLMANAGPAVAPFGGRQRILGTNPFAWAVPRAAGHEPLSFDIATAAIAEGKLRVARAGDLDIAAGLIVDASGRSSCDPEDFFAGGSILPFGGHKGSGVSILVQMLGRSLAGMDASGFDGPRGANGPVLIIIDPSAFGPIEQFGAEVDAQCEAIRTSHPAQGVAEILLPGEQEARTRARRLADGIPVPDRVWNEILGLLAKPGS